MLAQWSYLLFAIGILNVLLGLLVLSRDWRRRSNIAFAGLSIAISLWVIGIAGFGLTGEGAYAGLFVKLYYIAPLPIGLFFVYFTYLFPDKSHLSARVAIVPLLAVVPLTVLLMDWPGFIIERIKPTSWGSEVIVDQAQYFIYALVVMALFGFSLLMLWRKIGSLRGLERRQVQWLLVSGGIVSAIGVWFDIVLAHWIGDYQYVWVGPLAIAIFILSIAFSIIRHRMFDIRFAVVRGLTYGLTLLSLACVYYALAYAISQFILNQEAGGSGSDAVSVVLALLLAFIFQPVRRFFDKWTNRIFYRDAYHIDEFYAKYSSSLKSTTDLRMLLQSAAILIGDTLKTEQAFFYIHGPGERHIQSGTAKHVRMDDTELEKIEEYFHQNKQEKYLVTELLPEGASFAKQLSRLKIAVVFPLTALSDSTGYLMLGWRRSGHYSSRDIKTILTVIDETVIAIENALSVQEVRELNETLQQRIDAATKELRASNTKLQKLDATKDEFISMASHQLRTPLTSVKGYISMVLEGDVGKISSDQRKLLTEAFTSSERMVHLISDFLNVSRLQTGKFMIDKKPVDLGKLTEQEVDSLRTTAEAHGLKLHYRRPTVFPTLLLDEDKLRQVVMNFVDNAIYYSREHTVIEVKLRVEDGDAVCEVHDTGIGVPPEEQANLFTKFFRATNARKQRPDGTGVGLFLAKKIIVAHGGSIIFKSVEGRGSTFGFRLPIKKLARSEMDNLDDHPDNK